MSERAVLWTSHDAAQATGGHSTCEWEAGGVSIDTRTLQPGDLFVALKAARDGHDFVADALAAGASAALVSRVPEGLDPRQHPLLIVPDVLGGLEALGRHARARSDARIIGVTGSVGKTSTKDMLHTVLSGQGSTHVAQASYNNHWGVPLTLARMPQDTRFAVIEIGMNHPGEIAPLARLARPHVGLITTVAPAHLEAFENVEAIAREKASIFEGLEPNGAAVVNGDLPHTPLLCAAARSAGARRVITFGAGRANHHRLLQLTHAEGATVAQARAWRSPMLYKIGAPGEHFAQNALGVLAAAWMLGCDRALALSDLARWNPGAGRGARCSIQLDPTEAGESFELIDDSYNANPASVAASLAVLAQVPVRHGLGRFAKGRRVAVLGDMKELGPESEALHSGLAELPSLKEIDIIHCVGPAMEALWHRLPREKRGMCVATGVRLAGEARSLVDAGDVVLVKGSLSMNLAQLVKALAELGHPVEQAE